MPMGIKVATHDKPQPMLTNNESIRLSALTEIMLMFMAMPKIIVLKII